MTSPLRDACVVLLQSCENIFAQANVELPVWVLENVDFVLHY